MTHNREEWLISYRSKAADQRDNLQNWGGRNLRFSEGNYKILPLGSNKHQYM